MSKNDNIISPRVSKTVGFIQKMVRINIDEFVKDRDRSHLNEIRRLISLL